jgi:hypothetical protein
MKLGFAIASLVIAGLAIILPFSGTLMLLSTAGAVVAALFGDRNFVIAVVILNCVDVLFLSPVIRYQAGFVGCVFLALLFLVPLFAMWVYTKGKLRLGDKPVVG